jgi:class 3 adenylate cyclase
VPEIISLPDDVAVHFEGDANLLKVLLDGGIPITHLCGGNARCSTCRVKIEDGMPALSDRSEKEREMATRLDFPDEIRLACQTSVHESVRLRRLVLDAADIALASQLGKHPFTGPVGRELEVAVLFADVAGYTTMAEALPAYDVVHLLNRFFTGAGEVIEANSGRVDNYMGDAILALFGVEREKQAAAGAIRSGLGVLEVARELSHYVERIYGLSFSVRVGVDYGEVVYGLLGADTTARETAIGDAVNVASRLQAANKDTGTRMLVSDAVRRLCAREFEFGGSFQLDLRGKEGEVIAHEVLGVRE